MIFPFLSPLPTFPHHQDVSSELYGALMLTLSLVAVLLYGMKTSGHEVVRLSQKSDGIRYSGIATLV